jgi:putative DNA primase/helicase
VASARHHLSICTSTTGGAESWRIEHVEYLTGKRLVLLPDTDEPGKRYSANVQAALERAGIEFQVLDFDGHGNDFRDYLTKHGVGGLLRLVNSDWLMSAEDRERQEEEQRISI